MPGIAASTNETCEFGSPPKAVEAPEKSLAFEVTWACTSSPITTSHAPLSPLISFDLAGGFIGYLTPPRRVDRPSASRAGANASHQTVSPAFPNAHQPTPPPLTRHHTGH